MVEYAYMITDKILKNLELDKILSQVAGFAVLEKTKERILSTKPETEFQSVQKALDLTEEADRLLFIHALNPVTSFDDVSEALDKADVLSVLSFSELLCVMRALRASRIFTISLQGANDPSLSQLLEIANHLYCNKQIEEKIASDILSDDEISDRASDELYSIRRKMRNLNEKIKDTLSNYVRSKDIQKYLQDNIVTTRNERFVIPLKAEHKGAIKGLIHDYSASGATLFIEPIEIVEYNNQIRELKLAEHEEIEHILKAYTIQISGFSAALRQSVELLELGDMACAKAHYAHSIRAIKPIVNDKGIIDIKNGRHPLIQKEKVVPVSIRFGGTQRILLISGPNTGGKTVTLKMTGLFSLMVMCGLYIPASMDSKIPVFSSIFCDIGDEQSIEQSLSTFSSHITNLKFVIDNVDENSLVLLDEVGAGTDPQEGAALALAVLNYLIEMKATAILTTHFGSLKEFSFVSDAVENASMEFDAETLSPTYKLNVGIPGSSKALDIAMRLGLKKEIIEFAASHISPEKNQFERILQSAETERIAAAQEREELRKKLQAANEELLEIAREKQKLALEREKLLRTAKIEARRIVNEKAQEAEELLVQIKEIANRETFETNAPVIDAAKMKNRLQDLAYISQTESIEEERKLEKVDDSLKKGDIVFVHKFEDEGEVLSVNTAKKEATVLVGSFNVLVKFSNISRVMNPKKAQPEKVSKKNKFSPKIAQNSFAPRKVEGSLVEINLLGNRVPEALAKLDEFIDRALMNSISEIKIIHGIGTGALKKAVSEYLKTHTAIASFRSGQHGEGDHGVTIATIKN